MRKYPKYDIWDGTELGFFTHVFKSTKNWHTHAYWEFFYTLSGMCLHFTEEGLQEVPPGSLYIIPPEVAHAIDDNFNEKSFHRDIMFSEDIMIHACEAFPLIYEELATLPNTVKIPLDSAAFALLESRLKPFNPSDPEKVRKMQALFVLSFILNLYIENKTISKHQYPHHFAQIIMLLQTAEVLSCGAQALSDKTNYTLGHLSRLFKKHTGNTLTYALTLARMTNAASQLRNTQMSILDIAEANGYSSLSQFMSLFKRFFNITPNKYRNLIAPPNKEKNLQA